ncbi:MAG: glucosaminidase domain-containing protein [Candidatus Methylacidiphilales bacterium]|nr:glucosaminidase domain-containing protein [Candidatus Methylacidiphilales bacterium]
MRRAKTVNLMPALAMKRFYKEPKKRYGLWGTLLLSNTVWISTVLFLAFSLWTSSKVGTAMTEFYFRERAAWIEKDEKNRKELEERNLQIARMVAMQTSQSPEDVVQLANKLSKVLNTAYGSRRAFLEEALPQAIRMQVQYGIPASAIISQSIYESGYGGSDLAKQHHNYFGIKAFSNWKGDKAAMPTRDSGVRTVANFRKFKDLGEGYQGYADYLRESGRYNKAFYTNNGVDFVSKLLSAGYCPDGDYLGNIKNIMSRHCLQELDDIIKEADQAPYQLAWLSKLQEKTPN